MSKAHEIANKLGRDRIAKSLGVTVDAVTVSLRRGRFPASWFPIIRDMCPSVGMDCPESAFNWRNPSDAAAPSSEVSQ